MKKLKLVAMPMLAATVLSVAGCASYTIQPICSKNPNPWSADKPGEGYVFYQPELYFLVTSAPPKADAPAAPPDKDSKPAAQGGTPPPAPAPVLNATPIYLPNPQKPYRVTTFNFLAKSDFTFNFKDGWQLTSIADKADNTGVATALVGQMKTLMDAAMKIFTADGKPLPKTFLLRPEFDANGFITNIVPVNCADFTTR